MNKLCKIIINKTSQIFFWETALKSMSLLFQEESKFRYQIEMLFRNEHNTEDAEEKQENNQIYEHFPDLKEELIEKIIENMLRNQWLNDLTFEVIEELAEAIDRNIVIYYPWGMRWDSDPFCTWAQYDRWSQEEMEKSKMKILGLIDRIKNKLFFWEGDAINLILLIKWIGSRGTLDTHWRNINRGYDTIVAFGPSCDWLVDILYRDPNIAFRSKFPVTRGGLVIKTNWQWTIKI